MKIFSFILLFLTSTQFAKAQYSYSYPFSQDSILFNPVTRKTNKPIPFDKPFIVVVDKIEVKRVKAVYAYEVLYKNGIRELASYSKDVNGDPSVVPSLKIHHDTSNNKLILFFSPLKPLINFDINIVSSFSDKDLELFYDLIKDFRAGDTSKAFSEDSMMQIKFSNREYPTIRRGLLYTDLTGFNNQIYTPITPDLNAILNDANYKICDQITDAEIKHIYDAMDRIKSKCNQLPFLNYFSAQAVKNISMGLISLSDDNKFDLVEKTSFNNRVVDFKRSISIMDSVDSCLLPLYLQTLDNDILNLRSKVHKNDSLLRNNQKQFQKYLENINKVINSQGFVSVWLEGSSDANDLKTKSASLLSTDLGITNIFIKDNLNNNTYIPKVFLGLNIFFRPVDRNVSLKYLPSSTKYLKRTNDIYDNLSATQTILQHLSLSIGVTFGTITATNFDNLFSSMSLLVGPGYRFARVFKITSGLALLRRTNPNPLFTNEVVAPGFFASFSVDFDFLSSVKNFTDLITK